MNQILKTSIVVLLGMLISASPALSQQTKTGKDKDKGAAPGKEKVMEFQIPIPFAVLDVHAILRDAAAVKGGEATVTVDVLY